ncbi:hypothetical protein sos41_12030 [Alphaproteobacteria bacterium SO-S41]|nr:hypothetical protein sos41_12030 [Alphaproteobacteria bacterium SO-S41]
MIVRLALLALLLAGCSSAPECRAPDTKTPARRAFQAAVVIATGNVWLTLRYRKNQVAIPIECDEGE